MRSEMVAMRDGVRLATDIHLPDGGRALAGDPGAHAVRPRRDPPHRDRPLAEPDAA